MISKKIVLSGLLLGSFLAVGTTAFAFYPGAFNLEVFSNFSADQQAAIQQAQEIRQNANKQAQAVLDAADVDREAMREAMHKYREQKDLEIKSALDTGDYSAFRSIISDTPMVDKITEDVFSQLVKANSLREAGDDKGAHTIMDELRRQGIGFFWPHDDFGPRGGHQNEANSQ